VWVLKEREANIANMGFLRADPFYLLAYRVLTDKNVERAE